MYMKQRNESMGRMAYSAVEISYPCPVPALFRGSGFPKVFPSPGAETKTRRDKPKHSVGKSVCSYRISFPQAFYMPFFGIWQPFLTKWAERGDHFRNPATIFDETRGKKRALPKCRQSFSYPQVHKSGFSSDTSLLSQE